MTFLLKLVGLPLIALLTLMEWLGIFALGISQFITNRLAALIFFIACCCLLFGNVTFREATAMFCRELLRLCFAVCRRMDFGAGFRFQAAC